MYLRSEHNKAMGTQNVLGNRKKLEEKSIATGENFFPLITKVLPKKNDLFRCDMYWETILFLRHYNKILNPHQFLFCSTRLTDKKFCWIIFIFSLFSITAICMRACFRYKRKEWTGVMFKVYIPVIKKMREKYVRKFCEREFVS